MNRGNNRKPLLAECGCAWIAAVLLTGFLMITIISTITVQIMTSTGLHLAAATDGKKVDEQLSHIYESVDRMAEEYGFSADAVKETVSREEITEKNKEAAAWWTRLMTEGEMGSFPRWDSGSIEDIIFPSISDGTGHGDPKTIVSDLTGMIERTIFPIRESLLKIGMNFVKSEADLAGIIQSIRKIPMFGLVLCILTAGLIALFTGRDIIRSLKYYGTAFAAAGLILLVLCVTVAIADPVEMIAQASERVAGEIGVLIGKVGLETGAVVLFLLVTGYFCLILFRRRSRKKNISDPEPAV